MQRLPPVAGLITIESTTTKTPLPLPEISESPLFKLNSRKRFGGVDIQQDCSLDVKQGKKKVFGSEFVNFVKNSGKRNFSLLETTERGVCYRAATFNNSANDSHSGKLYFSIGFKEYTEPGPEIVSNEPISVELEWGSIRDFNFSPGTWKVIFSPFDGSPKREFTDSYFDDPYINISFKDEQLHLSTKDVAKIKNTLSIRNLMVSKARIEEDPTSTTSSIVTHATAFTLGFGLRHFVSKL